MANQRKTRGKQKIEIKKITNQNNLHVAFSKRRSGLFKAANELCTLCGAEVAVVVFSPGDKAFSFGNPNVYAVIQRYIKGGPPQNYGIMQLMEDRGNANVGNLTGQLTQINSHLDSLRNRNEELITSRRKEAQTRLWCAGPINEMSKAQLGQFKAALEEVKKKMPRDDESMVIHTANNPAHHQFFAGASSSSSLVLQPPHPPQVFPPQMLQPSMQQSHVFDGSVMRNNGFDMGTYGGHGRFF